MHILAKLFIILGVLFLAIGIFFLYFDKVPLLGKLPGDILIKKEIFWDDIIHFQCITTQILGVNN